MSPSPRGPFGWPARHRGFIPPYRYADMSLSHLYQKSAAETESEALSESSRPPARSRLRVPAWAVPVAIVAAFVGLFAFVFRDRLIPALTVRVTPAVLLADIEAKTEESATDEADAGPDFAAPMLFQAAGWFEPDPLPIRATCLTDGVIESVHVLEGQTVKAGQLLANLIDEDAELALAAAESAREATVAELHMHLANIPAVEADAAAILDRIAAAGAKLGELADRYGRLAPLGDNGSVSKQEVVAAKLAVDAQTAEIEALRGDHRSALAKVEAIKSQSNVFEAKIAANEVTVREMKLALARTAITSPIDGVVLELKAAPGQKKMLGMDDHDSATIAVLFETGKLQARVDVPLADARGLAGGQAALITSDFLPNTEFQGVVSRIVGSADLQRNTLQAKVRVLDPDPRLRPEMLCRVKFLGAAPAAEGRSDNTSRAVMAPESALGSDNSAWVITKDGQHAEKRALAVGNLRREGYVSVTSGLLAGELIILPPHDKLVSDRRVRVEENGGDL